MNFTCDNCQRRYSIADEKVRGKTVRVRCRHCDHVATVQGPPEEKEERTAMMPREQVEKLRAWDDEATRAAPPMDSSLQWFAMVKGERVGPVDPRGVAELVRSGDVTVRTFLWRKGMPEWKRGADLPELAIVFAGAMPAAAPEPVAVSAPIAAPRASSSPAQPAQDPVEAAAAKAPAPGPDPLAALGAADPGQLPPGEATRFFIAQAGVDKRNPPWKIALFVVGGIAVPVGILFLLSTFNVVPLKVRTVDASGEEVEQSVFSASGVSSLGDLLLGKGHKRSAAPVTRAASRSASDKSSDRAPVSGANMPRVEPPPNARVASHDELAALYGDTSKSDKGPKVRKDTEQQATDTSSGGLKDEEIARVVQQSQSAFQSCIEQELRRNPSLKVPRFYLNATVASSGVVKATRISDHGVDSSPLGDCLKLRARRMVFAHFAGDEVEVQIPLIVGVSM